jgi:hypothetical protein
VQRGLIRWVNLKLLRCGWRARLIELGSLYRKVTCRQGVEVATDL